MPERADRQGNGRAFVALILVLASAPAFDALRGIIRQIIRQPNYLAAITMGAGPWRLSRGHAAELSAAHNAAFPRIIGVSMAVYGVIGVFGFVNRTEFDLGVCLLQAGV